MMKYDDHGRNGLSPVSLIALPTFHDICILLLVVRPIQVTVTVGCYNGYNYFCWFLSVTGCLNSPKSGVESKAPPRSGNNQ